MRALIVGLLFACLSATADDGDPGLVGQSIRTIIDEYREQGYPFAYSTQLVRESLLVKEEPAATDPVDIVREVLRPYGLTIRTESNVHLVVRSARETGARSRLLLVMQADDDDRPVSEADIVFDPPLPPGNLLSPGVLEFANIAPGRYRFQVIADGFATIERSVDVYTGETRVLDLQLVTAQPAIELIEVSASRYEIARDIGASRFSLDQRSIQTLPDIGDDPLRAVHRLPGAAASGASAKTYLRGGDRDEIGILLNGLKLFDPFHVRDYQSVFSVIDSRAIEGVEVYTGGFPVRFGNRMSGMVLMDTLDPVDGRHTELGLSVYNTSLLFAGREDNRNWLVSARRGNLDLVISDKLGSPSYYDIFAEFGWEPNPDMAISFNALYAEDRVELILESDPEELERAVSDTRNAEFWLQLSNRWSDTLSSNTVLSVTTFDNFRRGTLDDEDSIVAAVIDDRKVQLFGFRQDFTYNPTDRHLLQWGLQVRQGTAEYDYRNSASYFGLQALFEGRDEPLSTEVRASPDGASYALYVADRWMLSSATSFEWGLRWDDQTYTDLSSDAQLSPRVSLLRQLGERTQLRLSWGRYHQSQEINELQVEDGVSNFWPAQQADHIIVGIRHLLDQRYSLRIEMFDKRIDDVMPRFENLFNPLGLIPEVQPDRVRLEPASAQSRGIEITLDHRSGPLNWWAGYVLSEASDRINGRDELRSWDQQHAFQGGVSFSNERWDLALAANIHTGWPSTELFLLEDGVDDEGEPEFVAVPAERNAGQYPTFASIDVRLARKWQLPRSRLTAFLEVSNVMNRRNQCCLDWDLEEDELTGEDVFERGVDYWMPILPAVGVLWEF